MSVDADACTSRVPSKRNTGGGRGRLRGFPFRRWLSEDPALLFIPLDADEIELKFHNETGEQITPRGSGMNKH